ncbi:MAG: hypothetical protein EOP49_33815, partial [Sphingobacteriales bacterium]
LAVDFAVCRDESTGEPTPQLIELQGFPSLYGFQPYLATQFRNHFPIPDSVYNPYLDDPGFQAQFERNGQMTTRSMFIRYYDVISGQVRIGDLKNLFKHINLERLRQQDSVQYEKIIADEPCYRMYSVQIKGDQVILCTGSSWNRRYQDKSNPAQQDAPYFNEFCAHSTCWKYYFDGRRLHLKYIMQVG